MSTASAKVLLERYRWAMVLERVSHPLDDVHLFEWLTQEEPTLSEEDICEAIDLFIEEEKALQKDHEPEEPL